MAGNYFIGSTQQRISATNEVLDSTREVVRGTLRGVAE